MPRGWQQLGAAAPEIMAVPNPAARTLHIRRGTFQAFVRLSEQEVRPVEDVMAEWLHDCGALIEQNELAEVYGDARQSTPAMRLAAHASDERERSGYVDDEEAAREHAALGAGYVELQLAVD